MILSSDLLHMSLTNELVWLNNIVQSLNEEEMESGVSISWSAHHALTSDMPIRPQCLNALLPLFQENANTLAMIKHSML